MTTATLPNSSFTMDVDSAQPWNNLPEMHSTRLTTSDMQFDVLNNNGVQSLILKKKDDVLGHVSHPMLEELSKRVAFPSDFITQLPIGLQRDVLNDRIAKVREMPFTLISQGAFVGGHPDDHNSSSQGVPEFETLTHASPGSRGILNPSYAAQTAWNIMESVYGQELEIKNYSFANGALDLRIKSGGVADVSRKPSLNDIVSFGIQLHYVPGIEVSIALYIERLLCLNGMTGSSQEFNWRQRTMAGERQQADFITIGVADAMDAFDLMVAHMGDMSEQIVPGDPRQALRQRARAMGISNSQMPNLLAAWEQEPDPSEFGMLNAVTRFATHDGELSPSVSRRLQATAGQWATEFSIVNCTMPRALAERAGARIIESE